ncbi:MAG: gliding motility protein GldN [Prevotella sp.]|nr:gliding motility protein GldN [Candidatus Prevotella equi]
MNKTSKVILLFTFSFILLATAMAQPAARRNQQAAKPKATAAQNITTRAQISLPTAQEMKEDVAWRRDIYREIDLNEGNNSGLYYPVEPMGSQMNLFTYLFKLVLSGQIKAYEYRLDGNESFEPDAVLKPLAFLDNYSIYYERKDGKLKIDNSDIPSREVKSYYIKESSYYDQVSATYHTKVIALCPIMSRDDDFAIGGAVAKYPLFWVKYDDCAPFLSKQTIMTSDINNAATMSVDDYFTKNLYKGKIYKTNNMLGQTLSQIVAMKNPGDSVDTDSAMVVEQKRIEGELKAFEQNIWGDKARKDSLDSIAKAQAANPKAKRIRTTTNRRSTADNASAPTVSKKTAAPKNTSSGSSAPRVSVRRQRH